uniref:Gypsy retrotransposon integrase-like protein 1 n=1 Tax=Astyanax mexicanus TaxID=7994 RepID=A0A3B1JAI7_ASTMX
MGKEAEFLGHKVDSTGLHPLQNKVRAIQEAPSPTNVTELKAYLGLLNYYNRFLPNLSTLLAPLHQLLRKDTNWHWGKEQEAAFEKSKKLMQSSDVLVHYDSQKDLILSCDASPYGVGAVLSHRMSNGEERPISFMSRTLTPAERNYSQLDKEGLAVMFGVQRFHKYLYGRKFTICTDHKPLLSLFNEMKAVPQMVSPRVQRWSVALRAYEYVIIYKPGKDHGNADALSRLPLPCSEVVKEQEDRVLMMEEIALVSDSDVRKWTTKDTVLSRVRGYIMRGWPEQVMDPQFMPFAVRKDELSVQDGCILCGARVVVPNRGRQDLLNQLHQCHPGVTRMKALARSYFWWPKLDQDIEAT